jgi:hypothetical protein
VKERGKEKKTDFFEPQPLSLLPRPNSKKRNAMLQNKWMNGEQRHVY